MSRLLKLLCITAIAGSLFPELAFRNDPRPPKNSFAFLKENFARPAHQYGTAPLWVWNTRVTRPLIDSMLVDFKKNAFGGVFVHPRPGLITEYLSEDWYDLFAYTVKKGKQLGLDVWIYDENSYPSGFAGGLLPAQMPESYNQGQMLHLSKGSSLPKRTDSIFVALKKENGGFRNITRQLSQEQGQTGEYYWFTKEQYGKQVGMVGPQGYPYVDLMAKGVTEKFIDITFKGYEKKVGGEFGQTVRGIFSDEPSIPTRGEGNIRWTPDLFSTFEQQWGYDLRSFLPSLFEEVGPWKKVRHNYQSTLLQLFLDRWSKPMYTYAEQHHLKWTGHYWEHGWPSPMEGPDNMAMYAWHQYPGIDMLFNQFNETSPNAQFGNIRAVKELCSVANQLGKERTLSETYGGGGWELTYKDIKRLGDWESVLGVNLINPHLSLMTLTGARKYDYPQSFSYQNSWWPYYKGLNEYFARLSQSLSQGKQVNDILVLEPTTSAWMYYVYGQKNEKLDSIGKSFQAFVTTLQKAQVEYDLGSENIIKDHGSVENGKFVVGQRSYTTVVIPPGMENIDDATLKLLLQYVAQGGKVVSFSSLQTVNGSESSALKQFVTGGKFLSLAALDKSAIKDHFTESDFIITGTGNNTIGGNLYHHRRQLDDGELLFLSNADMQAAAKGTVTMKGRDVLLLDLFSGAILDYPEVARNGAVSLDFDLPPAGSMLLFIAPQKQSGYAAWAVPKENKVVAASQARVLRPRENTLMIDFCDVQFRGNDSVLTDQHVSKASREVFRHHGFTKDPWDHQMQFKDEFIARDTFSKATGYTATYHFTVEQGVPFKGFRAVVEQGNLWSEIRINGRLIKPVKGQWWLDREFSVLAIGPYVKPGENTLSLAINPMSVYAEVEPVYILGDFNLASAAKGWRITPARPLKLGSWNKQGLPLYGHGITYVKEWVNETAGQSFQVSLGEWKGSVASVKVNGIRAGIIISEPNTLDITPYVKKGKNRVEVEVVGSLKNLLGPHHKSPKPGMVSPGMWSGVKEYPAGDRYDTYDYGLMEDFKITRSEKHS